MAYVVGNPRSKAAVKRAVAAGEAVRVFQAGGVFSATVADGTVGIEGPHSPAPHTWYGTAVIKDGVIVKVS